MDKIFAKKDRPQWQKIAKKVRPQWQGKKV